MVAQTSRVSSFHAFSHTLWWVFGPFAAFLLQLLCVGRAAWPAMAGDFRDTAGQENGLRLRF